MSAKATGRAANRSGKVFWSETQCKIFKKNKFFVSQVEVGDAGTEHYGNARYFCKFFVVIKKKVP